MCKAMLVNCTNISHVYLFYQSDVEFQRDERGKRLYVKEPDFL